MAVALDGSTPAWSATIGGTNLGSSHASGPFTQISASFSPPSGSLVAVLVAVTCNGSRNYTTTGLTCADSNSVSYLLSPAVIAPGSSGSYYTALAIFTNYYASAPGVITVSVILAPSQAAGGAGLNIDVQVLDGAAASQAGAGYAVAALGSTASCTDSITTTTTGSWVLIAAATIYSGGIRDYHLGKQYRDRER